MEASTASTKIVDAAALSMSEGLRAWEEGRMTSPDDRDSVLDALKALKAETPNFEEPDSDRIDLIAEELYRTGEMLAGGTPPLRFETEEEGRTFWLRATAAYAAARLLGIDVEAQRFDPEMVAMLVDEIAAMPAPEQRAAAVARVNNGEPARLSTAWGDAGRNAAEFMERTATEGERLRLAAHAEVGKLLRATLQGSLLEAYDRCEELMRDAERLGAFQIARDAQAARDSLFHARTILDDAKEN